MTGLQIGFSIQNQPAAISIDSPQNKNLSIDRSIFGLRYKKNGHSVSTPIALSYASSVGPEGAGEPDLPFQLDVDDVYAFRAGGDGPGGHLRIASDFDKRNLFLKLRIENDTGSILQINRVELINAGIFNPSEASRLRFSELDKPDDMAFFSNGWQSWSFSGAYGAGERQRRSLLRFIPNAAGTYPDTPYLRARGRFSSDFFGVLGNRTSRAGLLAGFLSQKQQFGSLEVDLRSQTGLRVWANGDDTHVPPGGSLETDWLVISWIDLDDPDALQPYFKLVGELHDIGENTPVPVGWCSWYQFYTQIDARRIERNVNRLADLKGSLPLDLIQIDDGFQAAGGDWFAFTDGFPDGVAPLAGRIKQAGMKPGLWLAPFIVSRSARLMKEHPEYLLRNRFGLPVNAGYISDKVSTALDISYPPALDYACEVVGKAAREWGFEYLKLDFLYAGALPGKRWAPDKTRAQILRHGLERIREAAGGTTSLLGCGLPLGSGLGLFDAMRIGADTGGAWKPALFNIPFLLRNDPHLPSARNAIQNTITRAGLHLNWWVNDPDCLLVRSETKLTVDELKTHATLIGMTGGSLVLSDDLPGLTPERLKIAASLLPLIGRRPQVMDWFDRLTPQHLRMDLDGAVGQWHLLAYFNWSDAESPASISSKDYALEADRYWVRSFWENSVRLTDGTDVLWEQVIPPHGLILLAVRRFRDEVTYLGSDLHLSQGLEVEAWHVNERQLGCKLGLGRNAQGSFDVYIPSRLFTVIVSGESVQPENVMPDVYRISAAVEKETQVTVLFT